MNERLATVLGVQDENAILGLLITKLGKNLQFRCQFEQVVQKSLLIFHELASAINIVHTAERSPHLIVSGRLLLKNDMVKYIMQNHASQEFAFLNYSLQYGRMRTQFYHTLMKLLLMDNKDEGTSREAKRRFEEFMAPMAAKLDILKSLPDLKSVAEAKSGIIGVCRDLRGVSLACVDSESYSRAFLYREEVFFVDVYDRFVMFSQEHDGRPYGRHVLTARVGRRGSC